MHPFRSVVAPWRAVLLAVVVLAGGISAANAAAPAELAKHPYVVLVENPSAQAQTVAKDHSRRFGVTVDMTFDRLRGYAGSMTDRAAKELAKQPGVLVARDTTVSAFDSPQTLSGQPYSSLPAGWGWGARPDRPAPLAGQGSREEPVSLQRDR